MSKFHGIIPPLVTPLLGNDQLDHAGLERLLEHVIEGGVHGLFILGSTGEAPSLSYRLRRELVDAVCKQTAGRVPVLVGVTDTAFVESVALAKHSADAGADAVVLTTPYYFPAGQTELTSYVQNIVAEMPLPLMLYNMPQLTKIWFEIETLKKLSDLPGIVGLKDSSGDLDYYAQATKLKALRPDWSILIGPEALLPQSLALSGDGGVNGGANVLPRLFVDCYDAVVAGDSVKQAELHQRIVDFQRIYEVGKYGSKYIKATKCCLSLLQICDDCMAQPFHKFHAPEREKIATILQELEIPVAQG
ncbi:dihydrodipicolinate synthase family protein [Blastopirellula retiformator]|uniref:Putative 2-keto-3-deoxy-galactonate aldolase YagE n=1 Tax=Blastopirellula retiformator TaxID=2527970 RepID=A0A5C5V8F7_9BACT|nr:dihydrodipicolinate synthase family protein [Blastopirellula retiformator]TWT34864.1 putative 2-keto-3-deoxy-galactonate aldolase YagE [Blastopirellula retiformator]